MELRLSNMVAAKGACVYFPKVSFIDSSVDGTAISDAVRTSLGPRGMDKMVPPDIDLENQTLNLTCRDIADSHSAGRGNCYQ